MPIIPLPTKSNALPSAPAPVLDRERRPTVDTRGQQQAIGQLGSVKNPGVPMSLAEPYGALGAVGKSVMQAGSVISALAIKRQEAESDIQVANADNAMQAERTRFEQWKIETNADPSTWGEEWSKRFGVINNQILSDQKLHPGAREQIALRLNRYGGQSLSDVEMQATKETFSRAKSAFVASIDSATEAQDSGRFESALDTAAKRGYFYPEEIENARRHFTKVGEQKKKEAKAVAYDAAENGIISYAATNGADAALKALDDGQFGAGVDEAGRERLRSTAKQVSGARATETVEEISDMWEKGELNSPEKIDAFVGDNPHVSLSARAYLKGKLAQRANAEAEAARREDQQTNGIENATRIRHQILAMDPQKDGDRRQMMEVLTEISDRVPESLRASLRQELKQRYSPEQAPEIKDVINRTISVHFNPRTGLIPYQTKEYKTVKYANDSTPWFGAAHKKGEAKLDANGQPIIRTDKNGEQQFEWVTDPKAQIEAIKAEAKVRAKMEEWRIANPDKANNPAEVQKAMQQALPDGQRGIRVKNIQEAMKQSTGKVTSYGYRDDSTPDRNSSAGIGAFVPDAEEQKIKRGEPSDYRLRHGDIAVSPDIEKQFKAAGIKPGSNVLIELANGETRLARWMDRTAQDEQILRGEIKGVTKPLRGRFDFYNPDGKDPHDGVAVVGWRPVQTFASK